MRPLARGLVAVGLVLSPAVFGWAQSPAPRTKVAPTETAKDKAREKAEVKSMPTGSYRTLVGTISEVSAGGKSLTLALPEAGETKARAAQNWTLSLGKQTLVLRANKNGQYSVLELDALAKGEMVQAVAELETDADKAHRVWWLISLPAGTSPLTR